MNPPHLFPAIDIRAGKAVRLIQGDYDREIDFQRSPSSAARAWVAEGAQWLHVVDLDGARDGRPENLKCIMELVASVDVPVQLGGGLRNSDVVAAAFDAGVARVVLGTAAAREPEFIDRMVDAYGDQIVVSIDSRDGFVAVDGWTNQTGLRTADALADMARRGVSTVIYTPIEVDGMEEGPRLGELKEAASSSPLNVIYASGVGNLHHIRELAELRLPNLAGVIVGTALYRGNLKIRDADQVLREASRAALTHA